SRGVLLQYLLDLFSECRRITFEVCRPFGGNPIELKLSVLQGDMRIKPGSRCRDQVAGNVLKFCVGMVITPHGGEGRLDVRTLLDRLNSCYSLAIGSWMSNRGWELSGVFF